MYLCLSLYIYIHSYIILHITLATILWTQMCFLMIAFNRCAAVGWGCAMPARASASHQTSFHVLVRRWPAVICLISGPGWTNNVRFQGNLWSHLKTNEDPEESIAEFCRVKNV